MELKDVQDLIKLTSKLGVREVQIEKEGFSLTIKTDKPTKTTNIISQMPASLMQAQAPAPAAPAAAPVSAPAPAAPAAAAESPKEDASNYIEVKSPMIGTFYRSAGPDKDPFIKVGDKISQGDVVCIVEAMKLFNEIESEVSGEVVKVMVDDASPVEYDQVLFLVDPS